MVYVPLLSNAYGAALFAARATLVESEPRPLTSCSAPAPEGPLPPAGDPEEAIEIPVASDTSPTGISAPNDDDDMETARTRPLRLDQLHL